MCRQNRCDQTLKPIQQRIACANDVAVWSPGLKLRISKTAGSWNRLKKNEKILQLEFLYVFVLFFFGGGGDKVSSYKWVTGVITTLLVGVKPTYNWIRGPPCGVSVIFLPRFSILQNLPNAFSYMPFLIVSVMFVPLLFLFRSGAFFNLLQPNSWKQTTGGGNDQ